MSEVTAPQAGGGHNPEAAVRRLAWVSRIPVRWGDMDAYGHVNNTVYFRFYEQARVEWLEHIGYRVHPEAEGAPVIINAKCTFLRPVTYPATVEVKLFLGEPGRSSVMTWYELCCVGEDPLYATGYAKIVWFNPRTGQSVPIPDALREKLIHPE